MQLSRKHFLLASLTAATSTALAACSSSDGSGGTGDGGTRTITDHGDKQVTLPATVTRVAIDQIPIESTYIAQPRRHERCPGGRPEGHHRRRDRP